MKKKNAFTFVELSIVLIVILVLVTGVIQGASMMQTSKLLNARSHTVQSKVLDIKGLVAWYENSTQNSFSESEMSDGAQLSAWNDIGPSLSSSQSNNLSRTASDDVTYVEDGINSIPSVEFDGALSSNITLTKFYQGSLSKSAIFIVFSPYSIIASTQTLLDSDTSGSTSSISIQTGSVDIDAGGTAVNGSTTIETGETYIAAVYFNGSSSKIYLNDAASTIAADNPGTNTLTGLTIGSNKDGNQPFEGVISEIIIYNRAIQLQERRDIFRYLSDKYKVTVTGI